VAALAGESVFVWRQHRELIELRAELLTPDQRAALKKSTADVQGRIKTIGERLAKLKARANGQKDPNESPDAAAARAKRREQKQAANQANQKSMQAVMQSPEFQKLMAIMQRSRLDEQYGALFKSLNLDPAKLDQLKDLLLDRQNVYTDTKNAAAEQGIDPKSDPQGFRQALSSAMNDLNDEIKGVVGDSGFTQLQQYQSSMFQNQLPRATVSQLQLSLSYTATPLTDEQSSQLAQILKNNPAPRSANTSATMQDGAIAATGNIALAPTANGSFTAAALVTPQALQQAASVLSGPQLQALQQLQEFQQSQQQLGQALQATRPAKSAPARTP
jgi:hypothetical protein